MKGHTHTNAAQKENLVIINNNKTDKYRALIEMLVQFRSIDWPKFQEFQQRIYANESSETI